jgi:hypothetical protein
LKELDRPGHRIAELRSRLLVDGQMEMGMAADFVAAAGYLSDQLGMFFSDVSDDEESGASFMGVEQIEESVSTSPDRLGYPADASRQPPQHPLVPVLEINRQGVPSGRLFWQADRPLLRR